MHIRPSDYDVIYLQLQYLCHTDSFLILQMTPSYNHQTTEQPRRTSFTKQMKQGLPLTITTQTWHRSGSCPRGTIPIRGARNKKNGVEIRKKPSIFLQDKGSNHDGKLYLLHRNHSVIIKCMQFNQRNN